MTHESDSRQPRRPPLAGTGMLALPPTFALGLGGEEVGMVEIEQVDPFGWTTDDLLLAESFARLDLGNRAAGLAWSAAHGAVDLWNASATDVNVPYDARPAFAKIPELDADEQNNVRWHLRTLARLSEARETLQWDPAWGVLAVKVGARSYLIGGRSSGVELRPPFDLVSIPRLVDRTVRTLSGAPDPLPQVSVSASVWTEFWTFERVYEGVNEIVGRMKPFGTTWASTVELERVLLEPYLIAATTGRFGLGVEYPSGDARPRLVPRETRRWSSICSPIYLQLFEALRRITLGEPGAATCRECGNPFLVLDARRKYFCNDRERYRHAQRALRTRLATQGLTARGRLRQGGAGPKTPFSGGGKASSGDAT